MVTHQLPCALTLRLGSEVYAKLPGFRPIPFRRIGLYADELRPDPPPEQWDPPGWDASEHTPAG